MNVEGSKGSHDRGLMSAKAGAVVENFLLKRQSQLDLLSEGCERVRVCESL